jgi:hypothetical protein
MRDEFLTIDLHFRQVGLDRRRSCVGNLRARQRIRQASTLNSPFWAHWQASYRGDLHDLQRQPLFRIPDIVVPPLSFVNMRKMRKKCSYQWGKACEDRKGVKRPEYLQVISPYCGEQFGTDHLNTAGIKPAARSLFLRVSESRGNE